jgi:hypothetical protein
MPAAADQNLVIVSIGDSLAAGEGNPDVPFNGTSTGWLSASCHKSVHNGRRIASDRINNMSGVSTQFFDFSCSGAGISEGLLGTQTTDQPNVNNFTITPKITQVEEFQNDPNRLNHRPIDILMIAIGANDAHFAQVATTCLTTVGTCTSNPVITDAENIINTQLGGLYDSLMKSIHDNLNVKRVYITEYPGELSSAPGDFCGSADNGFGDALMVAGSAAENASLLQNFIAPLNGQIAAAVNRAQIKFPNIEWRRVSGPQNSFTTHGYCTPSERRYVNTLSDSLVRQGDKNGTMHPNIAGHQAYADALVALATADFNLPLETPRIVRRVESNVGIPLLPLFVPNPSLPAVRKAVTAEIAQNPGTLTVTLMHRVRNAVEFTTPEFTSTPMTRSMPGLPNLFAAEIPGSETVLPFVQWIEYQVSVTSVRGTQSASVSTSTETIRVDPTSFLAQ